MNNGNCDFNTDCKNGRVCLLNKKTCVNPDETLIGFELNKKVYYAKTVEEIHNTVQQLVSLNKLDLNALKCTVGMNFESEDEEGNFASFVGKSVNKLRKQLLESKEDPVNLASLINTSDGSVYCENLEYLKGHLKQKLNDKNFKGFVYNKNLTENEILSEKLKALANPDKINYFSNFPLLSGIFIICNEELIDNLNTIVYYIVKLSNIKWRDLNAGMSVYHNAYKNGDDVHILIPIGDARFYCDKSKKKCKNITWDKSGKKPEKWDNSYETLNDCEDKCEAQEIFSDAVKNKDFVKMNSMLKKSKLNISFKDNQGNTYLHYAIKKNDINLFQFLVENGIKLVSQNNKGDTPLHLAVQKENETLVLLLLKEISKYSNKEKMFNIKNYKGFTPLHTAVETGNVLLMKLLLKNGIFDKEVKTDQLFSPLHLSVAIIHFEMCKFLLSQKVDINSSAQYGLKPLHTAVRTGELDIIKLLVQKGADINGKTDDGVTPLILAVSSRNLEVVKYLLSKKADVNMTASDNTNPLSLAVQLNETEIMSLLLSKRRK